VKPNPAQRRLFELITPENKWEPPQPPCLDGVDEIALDCETDGLKWWGGNLPVGIAVGTPDGRRWYLPWRHAGGNLDEDTVKRWARTELKGKRIVNLNTRFDTHMMYQWGVDLEAQGCTFGDVGHYAALLDDHRRSFSLENISQDYLQRGKVKGLDPTRMTEYHAGDVASYAMTDVDLVLELEEQMWSQLTDQELHTVRKLEDALIPVVCEMERNMAPINQEKLLDWKHKTAESIASLTWQVAKDIGFAPDVMRAKDMARVFSTLHIPVTEFTPTGQPSFTDAVLKKIQHPTIQDIRRITKLTSLRSKYLVPFDERRTGSYLGYALHQLRSDEGGTVSGRFSSSKLDSETGHNVQQVMAVEKQIDALGPDFLIRELYIPENGALWLAADAAQIEYRLFAHYSASPDILKAYAANPRVSYHELVWEMVKEFKPNILYKPLKNFNFAMVYGAGMAKISSMLDMPRAESDKLVRDYNYRFPEVARLLALASRTAETRGYVKTILGRRSRFPNRERLHKAINAVIQGSAADIMKIKLVELHQARKQTGFIMRFTVHDEVCGDAPDMGSVRQVEQILNRQSIPLRVPILWDADTGEHWAGCDKAWRKLRAA
jgi:DNA polymerase-1